MPNNAIVTWEPDTCGCKVHLAYDDNLPAAQRVYTYVTAEEAQQIHQARIDAKTPNTNRHPQPPSRRCAAHGHLVGKQIHDAIVEETGRKNKVLRDALEIAPGLDTRDFIWSFDADRVLEVDIPTFNAAQKADLKSRCDTGKVKVK